MNNRKLQAFVDHLRSKDADLIFQYKFIRNVIDGIDTKITRLENEIPYVAVDRKEKLEMEISQLKEDLELEKSKFLAIKGELEKKNKSL